MVLNDLPRRLLDKPNFENVLSTSISRKNLDIILWGAVSSNGYYQRGTLLAVHVCEW